MARHYGYIYTVQNKLYRECLKFGFTNDPHSCLNTYKSASPYPFSYRQLYAITYVPKDFQDCVEHDKVIEIVLGCKNNGYSLELIQGSCQFITGNYHEVKHVMEDFGYKLKEVDMDDIHVNKTSKKSLKSL